MSPRAPGRSRRWRMNRPAPRRKPLRPPSSKRAARRILQPRLKRSPRLPKPFSIAMASRRQQIQNKPDIPAAVAVEATESFLIFQIAGESFGLRLSAVAEIIRLPELAHMPLVPPSLRGLANLRGTVLPIVSLPALLHLPDQDTDE